MCSEDVRVSACAHQGAVPAASPNGSTNGSPPSACETDPSQSHSSAARGLVEGAMSSNTSNACSAPPGWLSGTRRSGSSPQP